MPGRAQDSDDEFSDAGPAAELLLGFVEEPEAPHALLRHRFPSKVGGRPAWLNPRDLPSPEQLRCQATGKPLRFLMQVYAPPPEEEVVNEDAFHRSIFLFVSPEGEQLTKPGAVRAFRCQLPRRNEFYSYDPPAESDIFPPPAPGGVEPGRDPWRVADAEAAIAETSGRPAGGGSGGKKGGKKGGGAGGSQRQEREAAAAGPEAAGGPETAGVHMYPEWELVVEAEEEGAGEEDDEEVQRLMKAYEAMEAQEGALDDEELPPEVVDQVEQNHSKERQHCALFQARIACAPDQCLRYCFHEAASPLCTSPDDIPAASDVPPCSICGGPRAFEFQVMPQLLNYLDLDVEDPQALDWGTIAVYSCKASCCIAPSVVEGSAAPSAYAEEYVWVLGS